MNSIIKNTMKWLTISLVVVSFQSMILAEGDNDKVGSSAFKFLNIQTDAHGQPINQVLIEEPCDIESELYLGIVIDRSLQKIVFMASTEGGVDIEQVAEETPNKIHKLIIDSLVGLMPAHARSLGFKLNLTKTQIKQFPGTVYKLNVIINNFYDPNISTI